MDNNSYEEYIRSVLGYPNANMQDIYQENSFFRNEPSQYSYYDFQNPYNYGNRQEKIEMNRNYELEECYPEIYKIVYPMVQKACNSRSGNVTKDDVDKMVEEIYNNIEGNNSIQNRNEINSAVQNINSNEPRYFNGKRVVAEPIKQTNIQNSIQSSKIEQKENLDMTNQLNRTTEDNLGKETRQCKNCNRGLSDIIRILLLRELIGRPGPNFPGNRPPFPPPPPPRPPHGRPPFPLY